MNNNLKHILNNLLSTSGGTKAAQDLKGMSMSELESRISSMNKQKVISELNSMNLGSIAEKIDSMSNEEILRLIKANPQFIDLISKL